MSCRTYCIRAIDTTASCHKHLPIRSWLAVVESQRCRSKDTSSEFRCIASYTGGTRYLLY